MKFPLQEALGAKYLYVSPDNIVHIFMPVVSGTSISLDNTCKSVYSLQEFFGKGSNSNKKATIKGELLAYKAALESDLSLLGRDSVLAQQKQERLTQIEAYLTVVTTLENHSELESLNQVFPSYPKPLEAFMASRASSNLYSMVLRPAIKQDPYLRTVNPVFSIKHMKFVGNKVVDEKSLFTSTLLDCFQKVSIHRKDAKARLIATVLAKEQGADFNFDQLRESLEEEMSHSFHEPVRLTKFNKENQEVAITQAMIDEWMGDIKPETAEEYIEALLNYAIPNFFDNRDSPFDSIQTKEGATQQSAALLSIITQFFLGELNIYCVARGKTEANFGERLDGSQDLSEELTVRLLLSFVENDSSIEAIMFDFINDHQAEFGLESSLTVDDKKQIVQRFQAHYAQVQKHDEFDEFMVIEPQKKGDFFIHQGSICTSFAKFASDALFALPHELTQPLEEALHQASSLSTEIPHKNELVQGEVDIDTQALDNTALQTLYERIDTYKDPKVKAALLAQLKQERPDFKPQIDVKQFLQCVAYGQRKEAEDLLKKNVDSVQELLTARNTSFTDYSGRTFRCSAYEYAFWAKDTRMCRMLERYMDADTKQEMLKRCETMEELIGDPLKHHRGLAYTQRGEEKRSAHVDLDPLTKALKDYIKAYNESPRKTEAHWEALEEIWIKVGLPQREVPAHIVHEYCHPRRSFEDISRNPALADASNDENLEGSLQIYNVVTGSSDVWFTPDSHLSGSGLGSSFACLRGWRAGVGAARGGRGRDAGGRGGVASIDLSAIEAIDKARTEELKLSLANLSTSPASQTQQVHGGESLR